MNIIERNFGKPIYTIYCRHETLDQLWLPYGGSKKFKTLKQARRTFEEIKKEIKKDIEVGLNPWPIEWYKIVKVQHEFVDGLPEES
jgi:hypothetical protein